MSLHFNLSQLMKHLCAHFLSAMTRQSMDTSNKTINQKPAHLKEAPFNPSLLPVMCTVPIDFYSPTTQPRQLLFTTIP